MLKWIKVRQNTSATTSVSATTSLSVSREIKNNGHGTKVEAKVKKEEEAEDSGMEREDSVCNVELNDLKKVRFVDSFNLLFHSNQFTVALKFFEDRRYS